MGWSDFNAPSLNKQSGRNLGVCKFMSAVMAVYLTSTVQTRYTYRGDTVEVFGQTPHISLHFKASQMFHKFIHSLLLDHLKPLLSEVLKAWWSPCQEQKEEMLLSVGIVVSGLGLIWIICSLHGANWGCDVAATKPLVKWLSCFFPPLCVNMFWSCPKAVLYSHTREHSFLVLLFSL